MSVYSRATPPAGPAPDEDVVISSRVRMARNLAGHTFVNRANQAQSQNVLDVARPVLLGSPVAPGMIWVDLSQSTLRDRRLLFERHLISKHLAESDHRRAVAISGDETLSIMVNEEDHLRMQVLERGLRLGELHGRLNAIDDAIEARLDYAFSAKWGYLTACPTNLGTGIRFSVMMHLPGLKMTEELERVRRAAKDLNLAVRGYHGEGSESAGDFYQISNQVTLGRSEEDILREFMDNIVPRIIDYERHARQSLASDHAVRLDDTIHRARATLQAARLLGTEEAMRLLSRVRLGACTQRLKGIDLDTITELFLQIQPAHLKMHTALDLDADALREARAALVRKRLG
jgi:protein arginine kinase